MPHRVAVVAFEGVSPFHLAVPCLVLGDDFGGAVPRRYDVRVAAARPGRLATSAGFGVVVDDGLDALDGADTVVLPSADLDAADDPLLLDALRAAHRRGARVVGLCLGAFTVAAAGLLDGREGVTHWASTAELAARYPAVRVRSDVLWSDHGDVLTSAGTAASLDCCLHLVALDHGFSAAADLARVLVMAPNRSGDQAQFHALPVVPPGDPADPVEQAMVWARADLSRPIELAAWSRQVSLSTRTFTRRFRQRTGLSPQQWLIRQRLDRARILLETSGRGVDRIARDTGFGTAALLRVHFRRHLRTSPQAYRQAFSSSGAGGSTDGP